MSDNWLMTGADLLAYNDKAKNILLTGVPRGGTTLACHLLNQLPDTVALHEPLGASFFSGTATEICGKLTDFVSETRRTLLATGIAPSVHVKGGIPDNHMADRFAPDSLRKGLHEKGDVRFVKKLHADFTLCVKHNAAFTALLPELTAGYTCFAIIRNPLAVLASWRTVELPVQRGTIPVGEKLDPVFAEELARAEDTIGRQLLILHWFFGRFQRYLPAENILRYEDVVSSGGAVLSSIIPAAAGLERTLQSRNKNPVYGWENMDSVVSRLIASSGSYWDFYSPDEVLALHG